MSTDKIHMGQTLRKLIEENNPSRELIADAMQITSPYLYKLYNSEKIKTVYFIRACQFMKLDYNDYIKIDSTYGKILDSAETEKEQYQKIIKAQEEALAMYRKNKELEEENSLLREQLAEYKTGTQKSQNS